MLARTVAHILTKVKSKWDQEVRAGALVGKMVRWLWRTYV